MGNWLRYPLALGLLVVLGSGPLLAAGQTPAAPALAVPAQVHILALGDINYGRRVGQWVENNGNNFDLPLAGLSAALRDADIGIANLECVLQARPPAWDGPEAVNNWQLVGQLRAAPAFARAGFNVLGMANNHTLDWGTTAIRDTRQALTAAGITVVGAGVGPAAARAPVYRTVRGVRVAILARSAIPSNLRKSVIGQAGVEQPAMVDTTDPASLALLESDLRAARDQADVVLLLMHWGTEYVLDPNTGQQRVATVAARANVDLVIGVHPHVAQPVVLMGSRPTIVAWSVGNTVFDQYWDNDVRAGLALDARFDRQGLVSLQVLPVWREKFQPQLVSADSVHGRAVLARIRPGSSPALYAPGVQLRYDRGGSSGYELVPTLADWTGLFR